MGVLNVTPDSFSDGGRFLDPRAAVARAAEMTRNGADIIDIGAESTRPGSDRVPPGEQIDRLREVLGAVAGEAVVSIDTTRAQVARFALDAGARMVNDVSAGRDDPEMFPLLSAREVPVILMHMLGGPKTMQVEPQYEDVVSEVRSFLAERLAAAGRAGIGPQRCILDPGIGFGKRLEHNLALLRGVGTLLELGCPVLVGPSRKRFIGELTGQTDPTRRLGGTVAACLAAWRRGATIFRVHDVGELFGALTVAAAVENAGFGENSPP